MKYATHIPKVSQKEKECISPEKLLKQQQVKEYNKACRMLEEIAPQDSWPSAPTAVMRPEEEKAGYSLILIGKYVNKAAPSIDL